MVVSDICLLLTALNWKVITVCAGKSFGITQIARSMLGEKSPVLTFNLSQFDIDDPDMLNGALHQVRDQTIKGLIPVVFWDEFDSQDLKWLQYLFTAN